MADKLCAACGELNTEESDFCASCGGSNFREIPLRLSSRLTNPSGLVGTSAVRLSLGRVGLLSILSAGLYIFYWFYLTWKHLASETSEAHFPIWHALTIWVPIYNLFRMHRHMAVIKELAVGAGLSPALSPGLAVVLWMAVNGLDGSSVNTTEFGMVVGLNVLSAVLTTALIVWAQGSLNQYWDKTKGAELLEAPHSIGEVVIVLLGILVWVRIFMPG